MRDLRHSSDLAERWFGFSLAQQLANVGSEVSRALRWRTRNTRISQGALDRALELIDLTRDDPRFIADVLSGQPYEPGSPSGNVKFLQSCPRDHLGQSPLICW